jgi:hypothetical protein
LEYRLLGAVAALAVIIALPYCVTGGPGRHAAALAAPAAPPATELLASSGGSHVAHRMCARTDHFFKY